MANENVVLTEAGRKELEEKLNYLENVKQPEVSERIRIARGFGDISENSEYDDAKNEQAMVQQQISEINHTLSVATIVKTSKRSKNVGIGSKVQVLMNGAEREFTIVGAAESNVSENKISNESPVGSALMGHKKDEKFEVAGPTGKIIEIEILKVEN